MARVDQKVNYYNFAGGKVSDANPLAPPENVVRTLLNVDLRRDGAIARRPGLEPEYDFSILSGRTTADLIAAGIDVYTWTGVDFNPELNFIVVRIGDTLYVYKPTVYSISTGLIHTIDISQFRTDSVASDTSNSFQAVSGKGLLVCSGGYYQPFYIRYNSDTEQWSSDVIHIRIRDFEGVDDGYEVNERPHAPDYNNHGTISARHLYNLLNQGWARWEINDFHYETGRYGGYGMYPANSDIASLGRVWEGSGADFIANRITSTPISTGRAPMGHFIIDPFDTTSRGRVAANEAQSGSQFNVGGEVITKRPKCVAFFAGRFFYGSVNGVVYYSKIVEGVDDLGKCYQLNDPTVADFNQLLDTDGGTLKILGVGTVERMVPMGNSLVVLGTSGIYTISGGTDKGFTANNQQVGFLSNVVALSYRSVVATNGSVLFWSDRGIFAIGSDEIGQAKIQSISDYKISKDYNNTPMAAKMVAQGFFEPVDNKVWWLYSRHTVSLSNTIINRYTDILIFDLTTGAFTDYQVADGGYTDVQVPYPMMVCGLPTSTRVSTTFTDLVEDNDGETVTVDSGDVYIERAQYGTSNTTLAVGTMIPDANGDYRFTFSKFTSRTFHDWEQLAGGVFEIEPANYESVVETLPHTLGEPSVKKQTPYVYTYYEAQRSYPERDDPDGGGDSPVYIEPDLLLIGHLNTAVGQPSATMYRWTTSGIGEAYTPPTTATVANGQGAVVSPDGNEVVIVGGAYPFINVYDFDKDAGWGGLHSLPFPPAPPDGVFLPAIHPAPKFSGSGQSLLMNVSGGGGGGLSLRWTGSLGPVFSGYTEGGSTNVTRTSGPVFSPGGTKTIHTFGAGTNYYMNWSDSTGFDDYDNRVDLPYPIYTFSRDGTLAIAVDVRDLVVHSWNESSGLGAEIARLDLTGVIYASSALASVSMSPDQRSIAYVTEPLGVGLLRFGIVKWNGDSFGDFYPPVPASDGSVVTPYVIKFSPDNKYLVFGTSSGGTKQLHVFQWDPDDGVVGDITPTTQPGGSVSSIEFYPHD